MFACSQLMAYTIFSPAASVTLAWDASPSPNVVGYRLYYGTASRAYTHSLATGSATTVTVSNLVRGTTYYFAVTAIDEFGLESDFSEEISYMPPLVDDNDTTPNISISHAGSGQMQITSTVVPGSVHTVQASQNMVTWTDIATVTADSRGLLQFTDKEAAHHPQRFYRFQPVTE
jgi:fibronectin type 3 domain-containing protein